MKFRLLTLALLCCGAAATAQNPYIALEGAALLLLLAGGTKSSQTKDIKLAKEIYESWRRDHE